MRTFFSYIIFFFFVAATQAGNKDSLVRIINSPSANDTVKFNTYYELGWEYLYTTPDSALIIAQKGLKLTEKPNFKKFRIKFYNLAGAYYQVKSDYATAIDYYNKLLKVSEELGAHDQMLTAYANIGALYIELQRPVTALEYQLKSKEIAEKTNKSEKLASIYNNLSHIYNQLKDYKQSVAYGEKSYHLYQQFGDKNGMCNSSGNLGNAYHGLSQLDKAMEYFNTCLRLSQEIGNVYEEVHSYQDLADVMKLKKNYRESIEYYRKALKLAFENEFLDNIKVAYMGLYENYKHLGLKDSALSNFEKYHIFNEELQREEQIKEVNKRFVQFEFNKKAESDSIRNAEQNKMKDALLKANEAQIEKDKILQVALTAGLILVFIFGLLIFNRFRITSRQKKIIEEKNKQTEEQKLIIEEKQKEILDSINYAKRIQDSLLDNFGQVSDFFRDAFLMHLPKDIVSGDFYWINSRTINDDSGTSTEYFHLAVCDSTGHGVPGGFMSLLNIAYLSEAVNEKNILEPNKIFNYIRERLINTISKKDQKDGFDGVLLCFEKRTSPNGKQSIHFSYSAAYNRAIVIRNHEMMELETDKMPVGYGEKKEEFKNYHFELKEGDSIYVYTDGYADQFGGPKGKKFKYRQLNELLLSSASMKMDDQCHVLKESFMNWKGNNEQVDDICVIGIKI